MPPYACSKTSGWVAAAPTLTEPIAYEPTPNGTPDEALEVSVPPICRPPMEEPTMKASVSASHARSSSPPGEA